MRGIPGWDRVKGSKQGFSSIWYTLSDPNWLDSDLLSFPIAHRNPLKYDQPSRGPSRRSSGST